MLGARRRAAHPLPPPATSISALGDLRLDLDPSTRERINTLIQSNEVMLFMKGNRAAPQCGFSATVVQILNSLVPDYSTTDVLQDPELRDGIKIF